VYQIRPETIAGFKVGLEMVSDTIMALSAVVVAAAAIPGINAWRKQLRGKSEYELARRYLRCVFRVRDAIKNARNPFIPFAEMISSVKKQGYKEEDWRDNMKMNRAVYAERWSKVAEAISDLRVELLEAEVLWGKEAIDIENELRALAVKLKIHMEMFLDEKRNYTVKQLTDIDDVIYDRGPGDKFNSELNNAVESIEIYLRQYLSLR
jgi:hypothetical protein